MNTFSTCNVDTKYKWFSEYGYYNHADTTVIVMGTFNNVPACVYYELYTVCTCCATRMCKCQSKCYHESFKHDTTKGTVYACL